MLLVVTSSLSCGEGGIRTPGASQLNGFQDRRNRPLCHLSGCKSITDFRFCQIFPPGNSKSPGQKNSPEKQDPIPKHDISPLLQILNRIQF